MIHTQFPSESAVTFGRARPAPGPQVILLATQDRTSSMPHSSISRKYRRTSLVRCASLLLAGVLGTSCSSAVAQQQERHDGHAYPVDIVFGRPSPANPERVTAEPAAHQPRPLEPLELGPIVVHEGALPPLADSPTIPPAPVDMTVEAACCRPPHPGECCPVAGRFYHRWHNHTKPWLQATHWGYPEYFVERPFGTYAMHAAQAQIANGLQDQQVLYHYDFLTGRDAALLSPRGRYQLEKIVRRMQFVAAPIIVQQTRNQPELDDARRHNVLDALAESGVPAAPEMVVVARAPVPGLPGVEGVIINENLLQQTLQRGGGFTIEAGTFGQ